MKRALPISIVLGLVVLAAAPSALAGGPLTAKPISYDPAKTCGVQAAWVTGQGLPDAGGSAHALYLAKPCLTAENAAAFALIDGAAGMTMGSLTNLSWWRKDGGHCGAGAPRWNVTAQRPDGSTYTLFLGCATALHTPGTLGTAGWTQDSYTGASIAALALSQQVVTVGSTDKILQLTIAFDEGTDQGPGFVYLDNITVNSSVMGSPGA